MLSHRIYISAVAFSSFVALAAFAQEALDVERPSPPPAEEAKPEATTKEKPAQSTKRDASSEETPAKRTKEKAEKASSPQKPAKSLEETMRPEEFKSAGLDKLNEDELEHLDAWLQGYRHSTEKKANEQAQAKATEQIKKVTEQAAAKATTTQKLDSMVSRVDGSFAGLKGRTLIKLEDGSVWRQANADDHFRPAVTDHPATVIIHTTFGYKMRIEGMPEFYVDPVVRPQ
jgi:outer membrane biosynthesis protein TonB